MRIAIVGATGFLGSELKDNLLANTNHKIIAISHSPPNTDNQSDFLVYKQADVRNEKQMAQALKNIEIAFYFIHLMSESSKDFAEQETLAAKTFSQACLKAGVERVIYMSGLGSDKNQLSKHLRSRHRTGEIMRSNLQLVIEFRASMIIGDGSISYDIVRNLVRKLPIITLPKWSESLTQPIAINDVIKYLVASIDTDFKSSQIIEIGGSETMTYKQLYQAYAKYSNKRLILIPAPFIPPWLSGWWLNLFTPKQHAHIGRIMIDSLSTPMVVSDRTATKFFPDIKPVDLNTAFNQAR
jgi:uncharacterized protein YbjT (DUF2867 family)